MTGENEPINKGHAAKIRTEACVVVTQFVDGSMSIRSLGMGKSDEAEELSDAIASVISRGVRFGTQALQGGLDITTAVASALTRTQIIEGLEEDSCHVDLPLFYPDGDGCRVYVHRTSEGSWVVSDDGDVLLRITDGAGFIKKYAEQAGIVFDAGELSIETTDVGRDVYRLAQEMTSMVQHADLLRRV